MAHYQLDLREAFETEGCRRLWVLICGLPPDSALARFYEPPPKRRVERDPRKIMDFFRGRR